VESILLLKFFYKNQRDLWYHQIRTMVHKTSYFYRERFWLMIFFFVLFHHGWEKSQVMWLVRCLSPWSTMLMKWLRYHRVISLKIQVGNVNQRNKWANTDPRIYWRWDQVPRRSKHPLLIDHIRHEPSSMIMNAEVSAVKVSVSSTV
jgi:hypothetical protein